jgi:hypothetical protein
MKQVQGERREERGIRKALRLADSSGKRGRSFLFCYLAGLLYNFFMPRIRDWIPPVFYSMSLSGAQKKEPYFLTSKIEGRFSTVFLLC